MMKGLVLVHGAVVPSGLGDRRGGEVEEGEELWMNVG